MGGFISGVRHAVAAQAITARRFRFQRLPDPGVHASPHQPKRRIEVGLSVEGGCGRVRVPSSPTWETLGLVDCRNPITPGNWPHAGLASHSPCCGRHRGLWPNKARWGDAPPALVPLFGSRRRLGARVGLEEDDGTDWIPGTALWVVADSSLCCTCAGLDCVARAMILPRYRGQERSGCSLCSGRKQRTVRNKQCQMPISPSEYFRLEFNQPSPRGLPLLDDQGMPFHPASLNVNGRDRGTLSRLLPISCCVRSAVEFWSACVTDGN